MNDHRRAAVPRAGNINHVEVVFFDDPVQVHINEVLAGRRAPVSQQHVLHIRERQRLLQQRIVVKVNLPDRKVVRGPPISVHLLQQIGRQRFVLFILLPRFHGNILLNRISHFHTNLHFRPLFPFHDQVSFQWQPVHRSSIPGDGNIDAIRSHNPDSAETPPCIPGPAGQINGDVLRFFNHRQQRVGRDQDLSARKPIPCLDDQIANPPVPVIEVEGLFSFSHILPG
jgi:hypothetical protein